MFYHSKFFGIALAIASTIAVSGWSTVARAQEAVQQQPIVDPKPLPVATGSVRDLSAIEVSNETRESLTGGVGGENPAAADRNPYELQKDRYQPEDGDFLNYILKQQMRQKGGTGSASGTVPLAEF